MSRRFSNYQQTIADEKTVNIITEGTPRYLGRIIKNVNVKRRHLIGWNRHWHVQAFVRIVFWWILLTMYYSSLVNRCMPLILAKIEGSIQVRQAQPQEKLTLFNDQEVELQDDIMVIADDQKVLAIAGIMGGLDSSVTDELQDIFLESAFFAPLAIAGRVSSFWFAYRFITAL